MESFKKFAANKPFLKKKVDKSNNNHKELYDKWYEEGSFNII